MTANRDKPTQTGQPDPETDPDERSSHHDAQRADSGQPNQAETGEQCQFVFDPSAWNENHDHTSPLSECWECPHAAVDHPDFDCCPFHLSSAERDEAGVNTADLRRRFREAVEGRGQRTKEFVGARLDDFTIRQQRLRAPDAYPVNFAHAEFSGLLDLTGTTLGQPLFLGEAGIDAFVAADAQFDGPVYLLNARVGSIELEEATISSLDMRGVCVEDRTNFRNIEASDDIRCVNATFHEYVHAEGCTCDGMVDFGSARIEKNLDLDGSEIERLRFTDTNGARLDLRDIHVSNRFEAENLSAEIIDAGNADIGGAAVLKQSRIGRSLELRGMTATRLDLSGATIGANFHLDRSVVESDTLLRDLTVRGVFAANHGEFGRGQFTGSTFQGPCRVRNATFTAGTSFGNVTFEEHTTFDNTRFEDEVRFFGVAISAAVSFAQCSFRDGVAFEPEPAVTPLRISFEKASIDSGHIHCCDGIEYDLTGAIIGDVYFDATKVSNPCFDYLRIANTTFEGFDFGRYKQQFKRSSWCLHTTDAVDFDDGQTDSSSNEITDRHYGSWPDPSPALLENTYLKAKNGAREVGDSQAAAEFFRREMTYRRYQHFEQATDASNSLKKQLFGFGRWCANYLLNITSGYGERPSRVVLSSIGVIFLFAGGYAGVAHPTFSPGLYGEEYLLFSFQSYVTFILGNPAGSNTGFWFRLLSALEGFIGAFLVALFVFTLTRSIHR